jgi:hypothetical protein
MLQQGRQAANSMQHSTSQSSTAQHQTARQGRIDAAQGVEVPKTEEMMMLTAAPHDVLADITLCTTEKQTTPPPASNTINQQHHAQCATHVGASSAVLLVPLPLLPLVPPLLLELLPLLLLLGCGSCWYAASTCVRLSLCTGSSCRDPGKAAQNRTAQHSTAADPYAASA